MEAERWWRQSGFPEVPTRWYLWPVMGKQEACPTLPGQAVKNKDPSLGLKPTHLSYP